jgi:hypothetical protein
MEAPYLTSEIEQQAYQAPCEKPKSIIQNDSNEREG